MKTLVDVFDTVKTRLESAPMPVYESEEDHPQGHFWVVLSVDPGNLSSSGLDQRSNEVTMYFRPMFVGTSRRSCLDAFTMGRNLLEGWNIFPDEQEASRVFEEETTPPLLPSTGVAGAFRYTLTPTYRLRIVR